MHLKPRHAKTNRKRNSQHQRFMAKRLMSLFTLMITGFTVTSGQLAYGNTFSPVRTPIPATATQIAQTPNIMMLADLLLQLESNILWSGFQPGWRGRREGWIRDVRSASNPNRFAILTEELQSNLIGSVWNNQWNGRRVGWLRNLRGIRSYNQVGSLLTELEGSLVNSAFDPAWRDRRTVWVRDIGSFSDLPVVTSSTTSTVTSSSSTTVFRNSIANLNRAKNYARQAAEERNGGLRVYRAEAKMHGPVRETGLVENPDGTVTFRFYGGAPAAPPSIESVVTVEINGWRTRIDYNGPIR